MWFILVENHYLDLTNSFWSWPNYGQVQINLVRSKPFWTDQNCFGHIEGQGISSSAIIFFIFVDNPIGLSNFYSIIRSDNQIGKHSYPAVTYAAFQHQGYLFWITCKRPKLLRKAGRLQLIQNSTPSVAGMRQCCIRMWLKWYSANFKLRTFILISAHCALWNENERIRMKKNNSCGSATSIVLNRHFRNSAIYPDPPM